MLEKENESDPGTHAHPLRARAQRGSRATVTLHAQQQHRNPHFSTLAPSLTGHTKLQELPGRNISLTEKTLILRKARSCQSAPFVSCHCKIQVAHTFSYHEAMLKQDQLGKSVLPVQANEASAGTAGTAHRVLPAGGQMGLAAPFSPHW